MAKRALAGTRDGARPCRVCHHARIRHTEHGKGACTQVTTTHSINPGGPLIVTTVRCACPSFTTEERTT